MNDDLGQTGEPSFTDVRLWDQEALVLFDWLMTVDLEAIPVAHPAQKQALMDLLNQLEQSVRTDSPAEEIAAAKAAVSRDMGW